ncbi:MAG: sugar ABC transporter permease [Candidatus Omnitrophica bacterium]|nr:sugar ABC transporter permease [Candidatus Omnitrophota bacterium]MDD5737383.1 sugar ABC transporter permease [Candidatus Omnitrophota bacterium]
MNRVLKEINKQKSAYIFIAPSFLLFTVFLVIPVFASLYWSFTEYNILQPPKFVGFQNYANILFHDPRFWKAMTNTVIFVIGTVPTSIVISLLLAMAIDQNIRFKNWFKTFFFIPSITSIIAISVIWKWLYASGKYGLFNHFLSSVGIPPVNWLGVDWTLPSIIMMSVWGGLGYNMILFIAGLQGIPQVFYEAAEVDGASDWDKFRNVTLPLLRPTMLFVTIMSIISAFQVFEQVYIMTYNSEGAVGGTLDCALTIVAYLYETGFQRFSMGYASALAYLIFFVLFIVTIINMKIVEKKIEY